MTERSFGPDWLADFHAGSRPVLEEFYRDYYSAVNRSVSSVLRTGAGTDCETVIHEVFFKILSNAALRRQFLGGSLSAWIATVARNHAIDYRRRLGREVLEDVAGREVADELAPDDAAGARRLIERFTSEVLPKKWKPVFEACFVTQMTQRDAARSLGISRTTLLYQQHRVRALLRRFLLEVES